MRAIAIGTLALLGCGPAAETGPERDLDPFDGALVLIEPSTTIAEHVDAGVQRWGDDFAIAVITATEPADCEADPDDHTTYCNARVKSVRSVRAGGLPDEPFWLHYWYPSDARFPLDPGTEHLAFLAPTHHTGAFAPSALLQPTPANVESAAR